MQEFNPYNKKGFFIVNSKEKYQIPHNYNKLHL